MSKLPSAGCVELLGKVHIGVFQKARTFNWILHLYFERAVSELSSSALRGSTSELNCEQCNLRWCSPSEQVGSVDVDVDCIQDASS